MYEMILNGNYTYRIMKMSMPKVGARNWVAGVPQIGFNHNINDRLKPSSGNSDYSVGTQLTRRSLLP